MKDVMVLLPGTFNTGECFNDFIAHFSNDYYFEPVTYPGLKRKFSEELEGNEVSVYELDELHCVCNIITGILNSVKNSNLVLVGHSKGALYAALALSRIGKKNSRIKAIIMLAPAPPQGISAVCFSTIWHFKSVLLSAVFNPYVKRSFRDTVYGVLDPEWPEDKKRRIYNNLYYEPRSVILKIAFDPPRVDLSDVDCPRLVIAGTKDRIIPPKLAKKIAGYYKADYAEVDRPHYLLDSFETHMEVDNWLQFI